MLNDSAILSGENVRVRGTVELVDEAFIHVYTHCLVSIILIDCMSHFDEKTTNVVSSFLVERGDFRPSATALVSKVVQTFSHRNIRN